MPLLHPLGVDQLVLLKYLTWGLKNLESLGFKVIIMPSACLDAQTIYHNPKLRADDIHQALQDPNIAGVISAIGGTDSARVLPYLDPEIFLENPKFFYGLFRCNNNNYLY